MVAPCDEISTRRSMRFFPQTRVLKDLSNDVPLVNEAKVPWLRTDWVLPQSGKEVGRARARYSEFVAEGIREGRGEKSIMSPGLRRQEQTFGLRLDAHGDNSCESTIYSPGETSDPPCHA